MAKSKVDIAYGLCERVGSIGHCPNNHAHIILDTSNGEACEVADDILNVEPDAINLFKNRNEMERCIQEALEPLPIECYVCNRMDSEMATLNRTPILKNPKLKFYLT